MTVVLERRRYAPWKSRVVPFGSAAGRIAGWAVVVIGAAFFVGIAALSWLAVAAVNVLILI